MSIETNSDPSAFEMSIRVLGNEFVGLRIAVDDFKSKWLVLSLMAFIGVSGALATFGEPIKNLFIN
jgi:hypothetical protein